MDTIILVKTGIQLAQNQANVPIAEAFLDSCFRRNDGLGLECLLRSEQLFGDDFADVFL